MMIRKPTLEEREQLIPLLMVILDSMDLEFFKQADPKDVREMLFHAMGTPGYRYSMDHALVADIDGVIAGVAFGYPGEIEDTIDLAMDDLFAAYNYPTGNKLFIDKETFPGEWYLDSLVTHEDYRGHGVGTALLKSLPEMARATNQTKIGLNCEVDNLGAYKLYSSLGFKDHSMRMIGSHQYYHMQWEF